VKQRQTLLGSKLPRDNPVKAHQYGDWGTEVMLPYPNEKHRMVDLAMPQKTQPKVNRAGET
jgi:hypothetical protein